MLAIFKILSPTNLAVNFEQCRYKISHHISNALLHYLVKLLCSKIAVIWSCVKRTCHARLSNWKHLLENIYPVTLASFLFTDEKIFTVAAPKNLQNDWQNASAATKNKDDAIKCLRTRLTFSTDGISRQSQVVDSTPVWYLSIMKSRLTRPIIVMWCCYNNLCLLYIRSQASSPSFSRTVPWCTRRLGSRFLAKTFAICYRPSVCL